MARYILLGKFSLNGVKGVISSSADRASIAKKARGMDASRVIASGDFCDCVGRYSASWVVVLSLFCR